MRIVSLKRIFQNIFQKKIALIIVLSLFFMMGLLYSAHSLGAKIAENNAMMAEREKELENYNASLSRLDESIAIMKENLEVTRQQYEDIKKYCEESIYMKLDSSAIYCAEIQYACNGEVNTSSVMNAIMTFYDSMEMRNYIGEKMSIDEKYLKEVLFYAFAGNTIRFIVYSDSERGAEELLKYVKESIEGAEDQISAAQGAYTLTVQTEEIGLRADIGVQNNQNTYRNSYKNLNSILTDSENAMEDKLKERDNFANDSLPEPVYPLSRRDKIIHFAKGGITGLVLGAICLIVFGVFQVLFGTRIRDEECLRGLGIYPLIISGKEERRLLLATEDLSLCCRGKDRKNILILGITKIEDSITERLRELFAANEISATCMEYSAENIAFLNELNKGTQVVIYVQKNVSKYKVLADVYDRFSRYDFNIIGGIFDDLKPEKK